MGLLSRRPHARVALRAIPSEEIGARPVTAPARARKRGPSLECGNCGEVVVRGFAPGELAGMLIRCPRCGATNESVG